MQSDHGVAAASRGSRLVTFGLEARVLRTPINGGYWAASTVTNSRDGQGSHTSASDGILTHAV